MINHKICRFKANRHRTNCICHHRRHFRQMQFNHITEPHQVNASDGCSVAPKPVGTLQFDQQPPGYIFFASEKLFEGAGLFLLHSPCECLRHGTFLLFFVFVGQSVFPPSRHRHKRSASLPACSKDAAAARTADFAASADTILSACPPSASEHHTPNSSSDVPETTLARWGQPDKLATATASQPKIALPM